jgi:hypothetical protein
MPAIILLDAFISNIGRIIGYSAIESGLLLFVALVSKMLLSTSY